MRSGGTTPTATRHRYDCDSRAESHSKYETWDGSSELTPTPVWRNLGRTGLHLQHEWHMLEVIGVTNGIWRLSWRQQSQK